MSKALQDIATERARQISQEGWSAEHDDTHSNGEMAAAALCYTQSALGEIGKPKSLVLGIPGFWPWSAEWWKPQGPRHDLVRAAALIAAEIERLDRLEAFCRECEQTEQDAKAST